MIKTISVLVFGLAASSPVYAESVNPKDLVKIFANGVPFKAFAGQNLTMTLKANGSAEYVLDQSGKGETGTWRVNGSAYCSKWGTKNERCFNPVKEGSRYNMIENGKPAGWWQR